MLFFDSSQPSEDSIANERYWFELADRDKNGYLNLEEHRRLIEPELYFDADEFLVGKFIRGMSIQWS